MSDNNTVLVQDNNILFSGDVDSESVAKIMMAIKVIDSENESKESTFKSFVREPINLSMTTNGGSVYDALALIDVIKSSKTPVHIYGYGAIMSAGVYIFASGAKRFCGKNTVFMFHESSVKMHDYSSILEKRTENLKCLEKMVNKILMEDTKITERTLEKWYSEREVYLNADEALKLGLTHEIL